jgi:hypothetical protein
MSNVLTELSTALATAVSQADSGIVRVEEQDWYILRIEEMQHYTPTSVASSKRK